jgi:hypothetical protein
MFALHFCVRSHTDARTFSKKIQFSLLNPQDTVKLAEYEVTHRDLYTATDRAPVRNGVLDRRLVCARAPSISMHDRLMM